MRSGELFKLNLADKPAETNGLRRRLLLHSANLLQRLCGRDYGNQSSRPLAGTVVDTDPSQSSKLLRSNQGRSTSMAPERGLLGEHSALLAAVRQSGG